MKLLNNRYPKAPSCGGVGEAYKLTKYDLKRTI